MSSDFRVFKDPSEQFETNEYGYWVARNGVVYGLTSAMTHGAVVAAIDPCVWLDVQNNAEPGNIQTKCDLAAVRLGWLRVGISQFDGSISVNWSQTHKPTKQQRENLELVLICHDPEDEYEIWHDLGQCSRKELLKLLQVS